MATKAKKVAPTRAAGLPTIGAVVNGIVSKIRPLQSFYSAYRDTNKIKASIKQMEECLGFEILDKKTFPGLPDIPMEAAAYAVYARLSSGDIVIFTPHALKGEAKKMRAAGNRYLQEIMIGRHRHALTFQKGVCKFPLHVRNYMKASGLDPDVIELLNSILRSLEFRQNGAVYKLDVGYSKKAREMINDKSIDTGNISDGPDLSLWRTGKIQITLPGKPKVRIIKKGVSIGQGLPTVLRHSLEGETLDKVIEIPGLGAFPIRETREESKNITHFSL
jgi:hypothetical protein